jgi:hypothetical protein
MVVAFDYIQFLADQRGGPMEDTDLDTSSWPITTGYIGLVKY